MKERSPALGCGPRVLPSPARGDLHCPPAPAPAPARWPLRSSHSCPAHLADACVPGPFSSSILPPRPSGLQQHPHTRTHYHVLVESVLSLRTRTPLLHALPRELCEETACRALAHPERSILNRICRTHDVTPPSAGVLPIALFPHPRVLRGPRTGRTAA